MTERTIASRPSQEQVMAIVDFMEQHPALALGQLRGMEGREQSRILWLKLTRIVNGIMGPTRPMKSWIKYWADKKSTVRSKVISSGGDPNALCSNIEKKIWDLFLGNYPGRPQEKVKQEAHFLDESFENEDSVDQNDAEEEEEPTAAFEETVVVETDPEERQMAVMEKLVKVMRSQSAAVSQLARAAQVSSQAMQRLAEASHIQARAVERLANTFETVGSATVEVRAALVDIDNTIKRYYSTAPT